MRTGHKHNKGSRKILIAALHLAISLRVIIPLGYMPGNALAGEFLVLCPQGVPHEIVVALHDGHSSHEDSVLDVGSACPIGQGLNYDALPDYHAELSAAPALVDWDDETFLVRYVPPFEHFYASRAPPLI